MDTFEQLKQLEDKLMTTTEVARILLTGREEIQREIDSKRLNAIRFKGRWLISEEALEEFLYIEGINKGEPLHPKPGSDLWWQRNEGDALYMRRKRLEKRRSSDAE